MPVLPGRLVIHSFIATTLFLSINWCINLAITSAILALICNGEQKYNRRRSHNAILCVKEAKRWLIENAIKGFQKVPFLRKEMSRKTRKIEFNLVVAEDCVWQSTELKLNTHFILKIGHQHSFSGIRNWPIWDLPKTSNESFETLMRNSKL